LFNEFGKGSEIFLPKLRAYSINDVKDVLAEQLGDTGVEKIGIRFGEKLHEILINHEEMRYSWEINKMYMIANPFHKENQIKSKYLGIKKIDNIGEYSSDKVEKISKDELKMLIQKSGLLD